MPYYYSVQEFTQIYLLLRETFPFRKYYKMYISASLTVLSRQSTFLFLLWNNICFKYYNYVLLKGVLKKEYEVPDIHHSLPLAYLTLLLVQLWRETRLFYVAKLQLLKIWEIPP